LKWGDEQQQNFAGFSASVRLRRMNFMTDSPALLLLAVSTNPAGDCRTARWFPIQRFNVSFSNTEGK
jgi:hypothetical protein